MKPNPIIEPPSSPPMERVNPKRSRSSQWTHLCVKVGILSFALWVMSRGEMVDFHHLLVVLKEPLYAIGALGVLSSILCIRVIRFHLLLRAHGVRVPFGRLLHLSMIGAFFGTFLPGVAGGDMAKLWYLFGEVRGARWKMLWTALLDRYLGVVGYMAYSAVSLTLLRVNFKSSGLEWLEVLCWLGVASVPMLLGLNALLRVLPSGGDHRGRLRWLWLDRVKEATKDTRPSVILFALTLSLVAALLVTALFYFIGLRLQANLHLIDYFIFAPISVVISILPIAPNGIGVGQVAIYNLFEWGKYPDPSIGATILSVFQVYWTAFNLLGAYFYLVHRKSR